MMLTIFKRKWFRALAGVLLCLFLLVGGYIGYILKTGNLHQLADGKIYRSGQLTATQFEHLLTKHGIRSVLNLRGPSRGEWYRFETNATTRLGVQYSSMKLSAARELTEEEMDQLVTLLRDLPKPLLIHCNGGADRTGLACALYRLDVEGKPAGVASGELNPFFGHIPYLKWRYSIAMDRSYWLHVRNHADPRHIQHAAAR